MNAWIFDVDGVITKLETSEADLKILKFIANLLRKNQPVAFNTGRWFEWLKTRIIDRLRTEFNLNKELDNLIIAEEKGASWIIFKNGNEEKIIDRKISISQALRNVIMKLVKKEYNSSTVFNPCITMVACEMKSGYNINRYKEEQKSLLPKIQHLVRKYDTQQLLEVKSNPIAIDINYKNVGKDLGIKRILEILKERNIKVAHFITVGDMPADLKMAEELHLQGFPVEFVYVGKADIDTSAFPFTIRQTQSKFTEGTLEFLKSL